MSGNYEDGLDYFGLILSDQDLYYEIRDYLREAIQCGDNDEPMAATIRKKYGEKYALLANDLIYDARDIVEYESRSGLS